MNTEKNHKQGAPELHKYFLKDYSQMFSWSLINFEKLLKDKIWKIIYVKLIKRWLCRCAHSTKYKESKHQALFLAG